MSDKVRVVVVLVLTDVAVEGFRVEGSKPELVEYSKWQVRAVESVFTVPLRVAVVVPTEVGAKVVTMIACEAVTAVFRFEVVNVANVKLKV